MVLKLPENVKKIIYTLQEAGFEAYAVGGCVRDALLGREPDDWDITTSALPEQVKELFARTIDTGLQHGTVTVLFRAGKDGWETYEVTTFRIDGVYEDARHPKDVTFTPSLEEDLKRRDFTINAMAYNETAGLIDCFDGLTDLKEKKIRCVGDAKERFTEDALRMMRAVRFAAQLGFTVVPDTLEQIRALAPRLKMISAERVQTELVKLLVSDHPDQLGILYQSGLTDVFLPEFSALMKTPQHSRHHGESAGEHTLLSLKKVRADKVLRLAMLFHDIAKPDCRTTDEDGWDHFHGHPQLGAEMTKKILRRLKFDNDTIRRVTNLVRLHDERIFRLEESGRSSDQKQLRTVRKAVSRNGEEVYPDLFAVMRADILAQSSYLRREKLAIVDGYERLWREVLWKKQCLSIRDLAVDGSDLIAQGIKTGPKIGAILHAMLEDVLEEPEHNSREYLLAHLEQHVHGFVTGGKDMNYKESYNEWLENPYFDEATKEELRAIAGDEKEIEDRFYMELEFGTAGLRGVIGAGMNRMNIYTVRKATQGLANYICSLGVQDRGVAIAYDSRNMSPEFACETALCLAANGVKAYMFDSLRPVPELSFTVRTLKCTAGVVITASHNPAEYNGYKVYWEDGAQITPPHDSGIMDQVRAVTDFTTVKTMDYDEAIKSGLLTIIGKDIDDLYMAELKKVVLHPETIESQAENLRIVYTPLHGTGNKPVRRILDELGFKQVFVVPEQEEPDGNFPTVSYPNPEAEDAFALALKLAKEKDADLVLATDPDADRLGVYVKDGSDGSYHALTGNMSGCLIGAYEIAQRKALFGLPEDGAFIKSIVSTNLADAIAADYGVELCEVLTGFKFIGRKMLEFETEGTGTYLFGMEESYGCLPGTYARDKDAVAASMVLCEAAAWYKAQGKTLWDAMVELYDKYGWYHDEVTSITLKGKEGIEKIQSIMEELRKDPPKEIGGLEVLSLRDYKKGTIVDNRTGETKPTGLPSANVLYCDLPDAAWVCFRPSGTEPKLKFYFGIVGTSAEDAADKAANLGAAVKGIVEAMM